MSMDNHLLSSHPSQWFISPLCVLQDVGGTSFSNTLATKCAHPKHFDQESFQFWVFWDFRIFECTWWDTQETRIQIWRQNSFIFHITWKSFYITCLALCDLSLWDQRWNFPPVEIFCHVIIRFQILKHLRIWNFTWEVLISSWNLTPD